MKYNDDITGSEGFTLIEVAIVIIITGFLFVPLFQVYENYLRVKNIEDTRESINISSGQISSFNTLNGRYPCPADPTLPPGDPNFGREFVAGCVPADIVAAGLVNPGDCTDTAGAGTGVCLAAGFRDTDADPDANVDNVLIGAVPIVDLVTSTGENASSDASFDAWNSKLTYAVSSYLTDTATYKFFRGTIRAVDEFGNNTAGVNDDGHYVVISHGSDKKGAYQTTGARVSACTAGFTDSENCDMDGTFVSAIAFYEGNTAQFYDDIAFFTKSNASSIWVNFDNPVTGGLESDVRNLNTANVGVGTQTPAEKLDVVGALRADNNVLAERVCEKDGRYCFKISRLSVDSAVRCGSSGQVLRGMGYTGDIRYVPNDICTFPVFPAITSVADVDCSPGWIQGITTAGDVICSP